MNSDILAGMLYCDITDHLPCFVSLKCIDYINMNERPKVRFNGERNCQRFVEMMTTKQWDSLYTENVDWYTAFINCVKSFYGKSFPWVTVSRKRIKDKPWTSKGLKVSIKQIIDYTKHHYVIIALQQLSNIKDTGICYEDVSMKLRRPSMKNLFQDTKSSSYNTWKHLGAIISRNKKKRTCHINKLYVMGNLSLITNIFLIQWILISVK